MDLADLKDFAANLPQDSLRLAQEIRAAFQKLQTHTVEKLVRTDLGNLSFEDVRDRFVEISNLTSQAVGVRLPACPFVLLNAVKQPARRLDEALISIETLSLRDSNVAQRADQFRSQVLTEFQGAAHTFTEAVVPLLSFAGAYEVSALEAGKPRRILDDLQHTKREAEQALKDVQGIKVVTARLGRDIGIESNARFFSAQAQEHLQAARLWLGASAISLLAIGLWAALVYTQADKAFHSEPPQTATGSALIQLGVAKVLIFSTLVAVATWCARNYTTHRHNYVVNRHRENALSSFETFVSATEDPQVKNSVLMQATTSIFAPQSTGYGSTDSDAPGVTQLIETVRTVAEPRKG